MEFSKTNEQAFEWLIERALVGTTKEERAEAGLTNVDLQQPQSNQYYWGQPKDMDKTLALDLRRLWSFLKTTQQSTLDGYRGRDLQTSLPKQLSKAIETRGVIVMGISPNSPLQQDLFDIDAEQIQKLKSLDAVIDRLNMINGSETVVIASQQYTKAGGKGKADVFANAMKQEHKSKNPTTRWSDIIVPK